MTQSPSRMDAVLAEIDVRNADDPRLELADGELRPRELVYSERMSECLSRLYPGASEALQIAARAQHICRWQIERAGYPLGRDGYNAWRSACRDHHATIVRATMLRHGYSDTQIDHVVGMIRKVDLKRDPESQALENVVAVVFAQHYLDAFVADHQHYSEEKLAGIIRKTLRKMDAVGHAALLALPLSAGVARIVEKATP